MSEESASNADAFEVAPKHLPPLRIHHFMLWTAVTAVMLTVFKTDESTNEFSSSMIFGSIPSQIIYSLCLTGLILGIYWRRLGHQFFDQPGQMAFILHGIFAIYSIFAATLASYLGIAPDSTGDVQFLLILSGLGWIAICIAQLVMYFSYAKRFAAVEHWSKFFHAVGILTLLQYFSFILVPFFSFRSMASTGSFRTTMLLAFALPVLFGLIELFFWFRAVKYDYIAGTPYHWTHWVGTCTWPAFRLVNLGMFLLMLLYLPTA